MSEHFSTSPILVSAVVAFGAAAAPISIPVRSFSESAAIIRLPAAPASMNHETVIEFLPAADDLPSEILTAADMAMLESAALADQPDDLDYASFFNDVDTDF